ncbi:hypothetical protein K505DRAFT_340854 [Melanomma pulvis-pyrius CBS 109.77]|uniref:Uncharacterized protein n=1 Tax=Melanomma pulvis-pyrius CBS 109.77 TaxID=1314802 RepID=A0A6A6X1X7_9PLEO|nr:hypothetical protein K505DRAFT_340854 [Melanomma pulvis-pyrius CBS 109.77]
MLATLLLTTGLVATISASPITKDLAISANRKVGRTDIYLGKTAVMTGNQDPYWAFHHAYDLCGPSSCQVETGANVQFKVAAPILGGLNHQSGEGTVTVTAKGDYSNIDTGDWKERNCLIEALASAAKAASSKVDYAIQNGVVCSATQELCNHEPTYTTVGYWEAPSWVKAVILDEDGIQMGVMSISLGFEAQSFDPLGVFSCDNAVGAVETAMDAFVKTSPYAAVLGQIGGAVCQ